MMKTCFVPKKKICECRFFAIFTLANVASAASGENAYNNMLQELLSFPSSQSALILPPVDTCRCLYNQCDLLREDVQA